MKKKVVTVPTARQPVDGDMLAKYRDWSRFLTEEARAALFRTVRFPTRTPAYGQVTIDWSGHLWVESYRAPYERTGQRWLVVDQDGKTIEEVRLPVGSELLDADSSRVLVRTRDELDVDRLSVHARSCT
ncbi:MAG: hypothetical protein ACRENP_14950 [Longimicrobiales bacterium]